MEKFCSECGNKLEKKFLENEGMINYCNKCNNYVFPKYNVAVSMIVRNKENNDILLIKQYGRDSYILVAGYVNIEEELEHAVIREIKEETNLNVVSLKFNRSKFFVPSNTLMCNFTCYIDNPLDLKTNEEVDYYKWFNETDAILNIKPNSLAKEFLIKYLEDK